MNIAININAKDFDQLGVLPLVYAKMLDTLPAQLADKLKEARFGYLNPPDTPEPPRSPPPNLIASTDEMRRMVQSGQAVVVGADGKLVNTPAYQAPETVVGEGGSYGVFLEFGGGQNVFFPLDSRALEAFFPTLTDEQLAYVCINIR